MEQSDINYFNVGHNYDKALMDALCDVIDPSCTIEASYKTDDQEWWFLTGGHLVNLSAIGLYDGMQFKIAIKSYSRNHLITVQYNDIAIFGANSQYNRDVEAIVLNISGEKEIILRKPRVDGINYIKFCRAL